MEREKIRITKEVDKPDANPQGRDGEESSPTSPLKSLPHDAAEIAATCAGRLTVAAVRQPLETFLCGAATGPIPGLEALAIAICREPKAFNLITVYAITKPDNPDGGSSQFLQTDSRVIEEHHSFYKALRGISPFISTDLYFMSAYREDLTNIVTELGRELAVEPFHDYFAAAQIASNEC